MQLPRYLALCLRPARPVAAARPRLLIRRARLPRLHTADQSPCRPRPRSPPVLGRGDFGICAIVGKHTQTIDIHLHSALLFQNRDFLTWVQPDEFICRGCAYPASCAFDACSGEEFSTVIRWCQIVHVQRLCTLDHRLGQNSILSADRKQHQFRSCWSGVLAPACLSPRRQGRDCIMHMAQWLHLHIIMHRIVRSRDGPGTNQVVLPADSTDPWSGQRREKAVHGCIGNPL
eukprot:COSAG02_NODE_3719_length_6328_cov_1.834163_2_plen_231_part_00